MDTFLFAANAVMPIVLLVAFGYFLKRIGVLDMEWLNKANKFAFRFLLSVLLFYNTYNIESLSISDLKFALFAVVATVLLCLAAVLFTLPWRRQPASRGALIQAIFRSNYAIIGIPLATSLFGDEGAAAASLLSAISIPLYNTLAVIVLTIFDPTEESSSGKFPFKKILKGVVTNPLILGVAAGFVCQGIRALLAAGGISWRLKDVAFLYTAIKNVASIASPFMLIILGGRFEFSAVKEKWAPITVGVVLRLIVSPILCLGAAMLFMPEMTGGQFSAILALFCTPTAVASAVMAKEMHSDDVLAGQLVVWTTVLSMFTLFGIIMFFRSVGRL